MRWDVSQSSFETKMPIKGDLQLMLQAGGISMALLMGPSWSLGRLD